MGISGLLQFMKSSVRKGHIREFTGQRVAIDASCWLHRGSISCAEELAENIPTQKYLEFFISMIRLLQNVGIHDILVVFDGHPLPIKEAVDAKRRTQRDYHLVKARCAKTNGDRVSAMKHYQSAVKVSMEMKANLIKRLRKEGIHYLVAPYEADAQLAYLAINKYVDLVITEDSDAIPYGCPMIAYKLSHDGSIDIYDKFVLGSCSVFHGWTKEQFVLFCCIAGCDYAPKIKSIGVKKAYQLLSKYKNLGSVIRVLSASGLVGSGYADFLVRASLTFSHQTVFCPIQGSTLPLQALSEISVYGATVSRELQDYEYLGSHMDPSSAEQWISGEAIVSNVQAVDVIEAEDCGGQSGTGMHTQTIFVPDQQPTEMDDEDSIWSFKFVDKNSIGIFNAGVASNVNWGYHQINNIQEQNTSRGDPKSRPKRKLSFLKELMLADFSSPLVSNSFKAMRKINEVKAIVKISMADSLHESAVYLDGEHSNSQQRIRDDDYVRGRVVASGDLRFDPPIVSRASHFNNLYDETESENFNENAFLYCINSNANNNNSPLDMGDCLFQEEVHPSCSEEPPAFCLRDLVLR